MSDRVTETFDWGTCEGCGEAGTMNDPLGSFWDPEREEQTQMHGECGIDAGLAMA